MQIILAPSKTMVMDYPKSVAATKPRFINEARLIVDAIREVPDISRLMHVSSDIVKNVRTMYDNWPQTRAPALFAYRGDVYRWFFVDTLTEDDLAWAQHHIVILSGLYGGIRPLDAISPYRLEMKTKLRVDGAKDLYDFWGKKVAAMIDQTPDNVICNLASEEYAKIVTKYTKKRVVTPVFLDKKNNGTIGTVPIYSKMMRGVMARWIIDRRIDSPDGLTDFSLQGYRYDAARSKQDTPSFYRDNPKPIRF